MNFIIRKPDSEVIKSLQTEEEITPPEEPEIPITSWSIKTTVQEKLESIQEYINKFEYNYTSKSYVEIKKSRGTKHIVRCALELINAAMPIQCVEACYIGIYFTSSLTQVERIPLSFKSRLAGSQQSVIHRHIVLALRYNGKWGAIGLSRRSNLMWKEIQYDSLYALVREFKQSYETVGHELLAVYMGLPFPHDVSNNHPVTWKAARVSIRQASEEIQTQLKLYSTYMTKVVLRGSSDSFSLPKIL
jgi:tubulinyl-Tyr carboxypeptidase